MFLPFVSFRPELCPGMTTPVGSWFGICNESVIIVDDGIGGGHHHRRYRPPLYGPWYTQTHFSSSLDQMILLPVQSVLPRLSLRETRRPPGTITPGSLPLGGLPPTRISTTGWSSCSISTQGVSGSRTSRMENSRSLRIG